MTEQGLPAGAIARLGTTELKVRWRWPEQVDFSPDGRKVWASSSWDGAVRVWDVATGAESFVLEDARPARVATAAAEGAIVLLDNAGFGRVVELATGAHRDVTEPGDDASPLTVNSATLTVDRHAELVAGCHGGKSIFIKALSTGKLLHRLELPARGQVAAVGFVGDGGQVAAMQYGVVRSWSTATGERIGEFEVPPHTSPAFRTLPGTDRALTWRYDFATGLTHVDLWGAVSGEPARTVPLDGQVVCHGVSTDGAWAAFVLQRAGGDVVVTVSLAHGTLGGTVQLPGRRANRVAVASGGACVATASHEAPRVRLWDPVAGQELHRGAGHAGAVRRVSFAGPWLVSCGEEGALIASGPGPDGAWTEVTRRGGDAEAWWDLDAVRDHAVVAATRAGAVAMVSVPDLTDAGELLPDGEAVQVRHIEGLLPEVWAVGHPDQLDLSMPPRSSNVIRLDLHQRRVVERGTSPFSLGAAFALSPTGAMAAVADYRHVVLLNTRHGTLERRVGWAEGEPSWALSGGMAFHPSTAALAVGCHGGQVGVLPPDAATLAVRLPALDDEDNAVTALAFLTGGAVLVAGHHDGVVRLWSWPDARLLAELRGHLAAVRTLAVSTDGALLASGADDTTVLLWNLAEQLGPKG